MDVLVPVEFFHQVVAIFRNGDCILNCWEYFLTDNMAIYSEVGSGTRDGHFCIGGTGHGGGCDIAFGIGVTFYIKLFDSC